MAEKIINLEKRIKHKKQEAQLERYRGKIDAIQRVVQCSSCRLRCAMCGHHLRDSELSDDSPPDSSGLSFCQDCRTEFEDFLAISRRKKRPDMLWHNTEWMKMWSAWLDYRRAIHGFLNSREYKTLLKQWDKPS